MAEWSQTATSFTTTRASKRIAARAVRANVTRVVERRKATVLSPSVSASSGCRKLKYCSTRRCVASKGENTRTHPRQRRYVHGDTRTQPRRHKLGSHTTATRAEQSKTSTSFATTRARNRVATRAVGVSVIRVVELRKATWMPFESVRVCVVPGAARPSTGVAGQNQNDTHTRGSPPRTNVRILLSQTHIQHKYILLYIPDMPTHQASTYWYTPWYRQTQSKCTSVPTVEHFLLDWEHLRSAPPRQRQHARN
jgi:hypothetical protein